MTRKKPPERAGVFVVEGTPPPGGPNQRTLPLPPEREALPPTFFRLASPWTPSCGWRSCCSKAGTLSRIQGQIRSGHATYAGRQSRKIRPPSSAGMGVATGCTCDAQASLYLNTGNAGSTGNALSMAPTTPSPINRTKPHHSGHPNLKPDHRPQINNHPHTRAKPDQSEL